MIKDIIKRIIAVMGIILAVGLVATSLGDFDNAKNWIDVFKALFWICIGSVALTSFINDYKEKLWPWEVRDDKV